MIAQANRTALVVVPTFNERDNLPVLTAALMVYPEISLLIVDDNSPDGTGELADKLARTYPDRIEVLHRTANRGLGRLWSGDLPGARAALREAEEAARILEVRPASLLGHEIRRLRRELSRRSRADDPPSPAG